LTKAALSQLIAHWLRESWMGYTQQLRTLGLSTERFALGAVAVFVLIGMLCLANAQTPADDVAAQVRAQGYRCDQPVTAKRDVKLSKPDSAVWILKCNKVTFRVRLDPDMAAQVKKLN
jgi:hypothetical protein